LVEINLVDLRSYAKNRHSQVDDTPYGGGYGMILKPEPLFAAVEQLKADSDYEHPWVILLTPQGRKFSQKAARELSDKKHLILICGRYEGVDERIRVALADDEISIGDYILTGGELAAAVLVDAVVRLLPGFIAEKASADESFSEALLEHPHYTRPPVFRGMEVPDVLLSGNHAAIESWRRQQSLKRTLERRPDLLKKADLLAEDKAYLEALKNSSPEQN
jgi:tRNA (guanine37-N1)-methyltransferase